MNLHSIKARLKKNRVVNYVWGKYRVLKEFSLDTKAIKNFKEERKISRSGKIKVGFIAQYIPAWHISNSVYEEMSNDNRFETVIICVPSWYGEDRLNGVKNNDTYEFFAYSNEYQGRRIINSWIGGDQFINLKELSLDYLIYTRPYNHFMPKEYKTNSTAAFIRCCLFNYGYSMDKSFYSTLLNRDFFRNLYCFYGYSDAERKYIQDMISEHNMDKYQRSVFLGYPALYDFYDKKKYKASEWDFSMNKFRVIWTPRWSTAKRIGGSNFLNYKTAFLQYASIHKNIDFLYRPHPLTFGNFIKTEEMTENEVKQYRVACETDNSHLDESSEFATTFWKSSLLITDMSSIIADYFATGKPIIYCTAEGFELDPTESFKKILDCCYIANNFDEVSEFIEIIYLGNDPLAKRRKETISEVFGPDIKHIPQKIVNDFYEDYKSRLEGRF